MLDFYIEYKEIEFFLFNCILLLFQIYKVCKKNIKNCKTWQFAKFVWQKKLALYFFLVVILSRVQNVHRQCAIVPYAESW